MTSSGATLFASNRGHNSIAAFSTGNKGASLTLVGWPAMDVVWPRGFDLTPDSSALVATSNSQPGLQQSRATSHTSHGTDDWEGDVVVYAVDERAPSDSMLVEMARLNAAHPCDVRIDTVVPLEHIDEHGSRSHVSTERDEESHPVKSSVATDSTPAVYMNEIGWQAHSYNDMRAWPAMFRKGTEHLKIDINWQRGWVCHKQKRVADPNDPRGCFILNHDDPSLVAYRTDYNTTSDLINVSRYTPTITSCVCASLVNCFFWRSTRSITHSKHSPPFSKNCDNPTCSMYKTRQVLLM